MGPTGCSAWDNAVDLGGVRRSYGMDGLAAMIDLECCNGEISCDYDCASKLRGIIGELRAERDKSRESAMLLMQGFKDRAEKAEARVNKLEAKLTSVKEANQIELNQALALAKPGRLLPLDENMGTNSEGVALLVEAIKTLAKSLAAARKALEEVDRRCPEGFDGQDNWTNEAHRKVHAFLAFLPPSGPVEKR